MLQAARRGREGAILECFHECTNVTMPGEEKQYHLPDA